jgi:hypothetical protein
MKDKQASIDYEAIQEAEKQRVAREEKFKRLMREAILKNDIAAIVELVSEYTGITKQERIH